MNGHSDVMMGAITTSNEELYKQLKDIQKCKYILKLEKIGILT